MMKRMSILSVVGAVLVSGMIIPAGGFAQDPTYAGHTQCRICHNKKEDGEQWNKWKQGPHAKAFEILKTDEAKAVAQEMGLEKPPTEAPECLRCHVTGYDVEKLAAPDKITLTDGVQCGSCHGPASSHLIEGKKFRAGDETANPRALIVHADTKTCEKCHNSDSPTWDPERYTLEDGTKAGFDFKQAWAKIDHSNPQKSE